MDISCRTYRSVPWLLAVNAVLNVGYTTGLIPAWTSLALFVVAVVMAAIAKRHLFLRRCEATCFTRQPIDGPTMHGLTIGARWHRISSVLAIGSMVLVGVLVVGFLVRAFTDHELSWLAVVMPVWMFAVAGDVYAEQQHNRSWCPICWRRGGWDDHHHDRVPDPDPSTSAPIH